jgi:hypothetical protein
MQLGWFFVSPVSKETIDKMKKLNKKCLCNMFLEKFKKVIYGSSVSISAIVISSSISMEDSI